MNTSVRMEMELQNRPVKAAYVAVFLAVSVVCCGCSNTKTITASSSHSNPGSLIVNMQPGTHIINIGDLIELSVPGYPEFQTSTTVKESGSLMVPLLGEIHAAGLTKQQLLETLRKKLGEFIKGQPEISLGISSPPSQKISVLGAVTRQENYPVSGALSLTEALSNAGGTTPDADLGHVRVIHNGNTNDVAEIDLSSFLEIGNLDAIPKVISGDVIFVPTKSTTLRTAYEILRDALIIYATYRVIYK